MKKFNRPLEIDYEPELVPARKAASEASLRHPIRMLRAGQRHAKAHGAACKRFTERSQR